MTVYYFKWLVKCQCLSINRNMKEMYRIVHNKINVLCTIIKKIQPFDKII